MPKTLAELIADAAAGDDLQFTGPDGMVVKLSDIRGFRSIVDTEAKTLKSKREEAERIATEADTLLKSLQLAMKEQQKKDAPPDKKNDDWRKNPLYEDILPVVDELKAIAQGARDQVTTLKASLDQSQAVYALERMRRQWAESTVKPKDKTFEQVVAEVLASKELDELGLPTLQKYMHRVTEPDRIAAAREEGKKEGKAEAEKAQRAAAIPKPGKFTVKDAGKSAPPIKNLSELTSEAVAKAAGEDADFAAAIEGMVQ
jgi:hypothetical protein